MSTHLTGYDQQVRQFMALCMLARTPVATVESREEAAPEPPLLDRPKAG
jgi:hypothetical protein